MKKFKIRYYKNAPGFSVKAPRRPEVYYTGYTVSEAIQAYAEKYM